MKLTVVTPERQFLDAECDEVTVPGSLGYLGILPGHAPLLASLGTGELAYRTGARNHYLVVAGGFVEVMNDEVRILADFAEHPSEIDVEAAKRARTAAEERMKLTASHELDVATAELALAVTRIQVAGRG